MNRNPELTPEEQEAKDRQEYPFGVPGRVKIERWKAQEEKKRQSEAEKSFTNFDWTKAQKLKESCNG